MHSLRRCGDAALAAGNGVRHLRRGGTLATTASALPLAHVSAPSLPATIFFILIDAGNEELIFGNHQFHKR
jgi:hypothetical protein